MDLPLVKTPIGQWLFLEQCCVMEHCSAVVVTVVVTPKAAADVLQPPAPNEIASCSMNGINSICMVITVALP